MTIIELDDGGIMVDFEGASAEGSLDRPIGRLHASIVRRDLGAAWDWVAESTAVRELDTFSAEHVESLKQPQNDGPEPMSDLEKAARAVCTRLGWDPDCIAYATPVHQTHIADRAYVFTLPPHEHSAPLWTFFTAEAEAALSVLDI